jgi:hypothetical protein
VGARLRVLPGQLRRLGEAIRPAHRPVGEPVLEDIHELVRAMAGRRHVGGIEQDQGLPGEAELDGVLHRRAGGHGVEHADARLAAPARADLAHDPVEVERHLGVRVAIAPGRGGRILAVVAEVEDDDLEPVGEGAPERVVPVDREAVAIGHDEPHGGLAPPVTADTDASAVAHDEVERLGRGRDRDPHRPATVVDRRARCQTDG